MTDPVFGINISKEKTQFDICRIFILISDLPARIIHADRQPATYDNHNQPKLKRQNV